MQRVKQTASNSQSLVNILIFRASLISAFILIFWNHAWKYYLSWDCLATQSFTSSLPTNYLYLFSIGWFGYPLNYCVPGHTCSPLCLCCKYYRCSPLCVCVIWAVLSGPSVSQKHAVFQAHPGEQDMLSLVAMKPSWSCQGCRSLPSIPLFSLPRTQPRWEEAGTTVYISCLPALSSFLPPSRMYLHLPINNMYLFLCGQKATSCHLSMVWILCSRASEIMVLIVKPSFKNASKTHFLHEVPSFA